MVIAFVLHGGLACPIEGGVNEVNSGVDLLLCAQPAPHNGGEVLHGAMPLCPAVLIQVCVKSVSVVTPRALYVVWHAGQGVDECMAQAE